jgi:hypothetical protein
MSKPRFTPEVADLIYVVQRWSSADDWNVESIYVNTIEALAEALAAGDDATTLARHAQHVGSECDRIKCADLIPFEFERDGGARRAAERAAEDAS